jgi:hypothetical protein
MKHISFLIFIFMSASIHAQPRGQEEQTPQPPTKELASYISYLQQTGQLPTPQQEPNKDAKNTKDAVGKDAMSEEKKFQDATSGILTGMLAVISGASAGDPLQIASGIFTMFGAAFLAATRNRVQDEEAAPHITRSRSYTQRNQELRDRIGSFMRQQTPPFRKRV